MEFNEEEQTDLIEVTEPLKKQVGRLFIRKDVFLKPKGVKVLGLYYDKIRRQNILRIEYDKGSWLVGLTIDNYNQLIDKFGTDVNAWKEKTLIVKATQGVFTIRNKDQTTSEIEGYNLSFA